MRYLLYLPGIILILLPFILRELSDEAEADTQRRKEAERAAAEEQRRIEAEAKKAEKEAQAAEREAVRAAKEAERQRKQAERLEAARLRAEYAERELAAKRAARELDKAKPEPTPENHSSEPDTQDEDEVSAPEPAIEPLTAKPMPQIKGNNAFKGHVVAFTGRLPGMTRAKAIQAVQDNGGRAYTKMPAGTTLLVVGDKPGMCKMDKADEWIGQVRKITAAQFFEMLSQPLTLEPEEFEAMFAARFAA